MGWVYLILVCIALALIAMVVGAVWNLGVSILYFGLVWAPPVLLCSMLLALSPTFTRTVFIIYREQGARNWTSSPADIRDAWRKSPIPWLVMPIMLLATLAWACLSPWPTLWPGGLDLGFAFERDWGWSESSLHGLFLARSYGATFICALPVALSAGALRWIAGRQFVRRVEQIDQHIHGTDSHTQNLRDKDNLVREGYRRLGAAHADHYADTFRTWVNASVQEIVRDPNTAGSKFRELERQADAELGRLTLCLQRFDDTRAGLERAIALQRKIPSRTLFHSLEEIEELLVSHQFTGMVESGKWKEVDAFLQEVTKSLHDLESLAKEWAGSEPGSGPDSPKMTIEHALVITGLKKSYTPDDLKERKRLLNKLYHPDRMDEENREVCNRKLAEINEAINLLARRL